MGVDDVSEVLNAQAEADEQPRPQGLGLGARFLPHNKAVSLVANVDRRLGKRLQRSAQQEAGDGAEGKGGSRGRKAGKQAESSEDEDDDVGRAQAFKRTKPGPTLHLKQSFMATSKTGKKKKKNKGQQPPSSQ